MNYPGVGLLPKLPTQTKTGSPLVNGRLDPCDLESVFLPGIGLGALHPVAKRAWDCLAIVCRAETGAMLTATSSADTYRSYAQQEAVFRQRMLPRYDPIRCTTITRTWNGQKWWLRRGVAQVATPGTSNHGFGIAVDIGVWSGSKVLSLASQGIAWNWMLANAGTFGFGWELQSESWHLRHMHGNEVTRRVKDVEAFLGAKA